MKQSTKSLKSIVLIFSAVLLVFTSFPYATLAEDELTTGSCGDNATYSFDATTGTLTIGGAGHMTDYNSDDQPWCNTSAKIKRVVIQSGVTSIGDFAFNNCFRIEQVEISETVTSIGKSAFSQNYYLTTIEIPFSVERIGQYALENCSKLQSINVDTNNNNFCSIDGVLYNKEVTELIKYPQNKQDSTYVMPDTLETIATYAIRQALIEKIYISKNLSNMTLGVNPSSITGTQFKSIVVDEHNENYSSQDGVLFNKEKTKLLMFPSGNTDMNEYVIPNSVKEIHTDAFIFAKIKNVIIPNSVEKIGDEAFLGSNLIEISIPDSVTSMGVGTFNNCYTLEKVEIGKGLTEIGSSCFDRNKSLVEVVIPENIIKINPYCFRGCESLTSFTVLNPDCVLGGLASDFYKTTNFYGIQNSTLQTFAEKNGFNFGIVCSDGTNNHDFDVLLTYADDCLSLTTTFTCTKCGYSYEENEELFGHVWGDYIYKEETRSHYRICANDETHIEEQSCYIGDADVTEPTCTETGKIIYTCAVCNGTWTEELDKLPHEYEAVVTAPTCTQNGFTTYICSACGDTYIDDTTDIISHEYVESVTAPTCTEQGYTTYTCKNCGDTYTTAYTDALGHNFDDSERDCLNGCGEENPNYTETITDPTDPENTTVAEQKTTVKTTETTNKKSEAVKSIPNNDYTGSRDTAYDDFRIIPGYGQIKAALTNDSKLDGYEVYISTDNKNFKKIADITVKSANYCIIDDLSTGQVYYVKVKGYLYHNDKKIEMSSFSNTQSLSVK